MTPARAARLLLQPTRGALREQFSQSSRPRARFLPLPSGPLASIASTCPRCSIRASFRLYTTGPKASSSNVKNQEDGVVSPRSSAGSPDSASSTNAEQPNARRLSSDPELPSDSEAKRSVASARFSGFMDDMQSRVLNASQKINDLTGYSAIESIKAKNTALEAELTAAQTRLRTARQAYKTLTSTRAATQREVTTLLARKDTWTPMDLERFTTLYRSDHELEAQVAAASTELTEAESEEGKLGAALNAGILRRYHEEQIWSDGIRRQSTWGTWGLMGVNVLLFIVLQFVAEPWKRQRLIRGVAEGEKSHWEEVRKELGEMKAAMEESKTGRAVQSHLSDGRDAAVLGASDGAENIALPEVLEAPSSTNWWETMANPKGWTEGLQDLYSERKIALRMRDASLIALEGAVTGAAVAVGVAMFLLRTS